MSLPVARHPAPSLALALAVMGGSSALRTIVYNALRVHGSGGYSPSGLSQLARSMLVSLGGFAFTLSATAAAALAAVALVRARRSPGAAVAAVALIAGTLAGTVDVIAVWLYPDVEATRGWRHQAIQLAHWTYFAQGGLVVLGLAAAGWADRSVRLVTPAALGGALLAAPPPPLVRWAYERAERGALVIDGGTMTIDHTRMWLVPLAMAAGAATWAATCAWIAHRQPRIPADAMAPRPPARVLRAFALSILSMAVIGIGAGLVIAVVQGRRHADTGILPVLIPVAVGSATAGVAAALLALSITDVGARANRCFAAGAILVSWCVVVVAAQTLWSRRPYPPNSRFTVFEAPWMPGMVGAVVAVGALLCMAAGLAAAARHAGQRPSRFQLVVVVLALVIGAATVPWLLGFGTRALPLDGLRIATLGSATVVNLAAWIALARTAWRTAAATRA